MKSRKQNIIDNFKNIIFPKIANDLYEINYEGMGEIDRKEFSEDTAILIDLAQKGLKATKTKEVEYSGDGYSDGEMVYDMAKCPSCGFEYEYGDCIWGELYCPHCGQHLKW